MLSIRRYLLLSLILALVAGSLLVTVFTYFNAADEIDELYDKSMEEIATTLQSQLEPLRLHEYKVKGAVGPSLRANIKEEQDVLIQIWSRNKESIYTSHRAIKLPLQDGHGLLTSEFEGRQWRNYIAETPHFIIQVSQPQKARNAFIREMATHLLYPLAALIPVTGLFIWLAVGRSLAPLDLIADAIKQRSATSLAPLPEEGVPLEIRPMVQELNELLMRLKTSLDSQKRFTADAAHELRTPLTALQLQLGILSRAGEASERKEAIGKLQGGIDRAVHVVQQLLTLARLEPESVEHPHTTVNLALIARNVIEHYTEQALQKNIALSDSGIETARLSGSEDTLRILIENIVDNALRYTPQGGKVDVLTYSTKDQAIIEVRDNGIGIPEQERDRIFERFHRIIGTDSDGTGLGLSIAKNIVEQHGGTIAVSSGIEGKGSSFTIRFPRHG